MPPTPMTHEDYMRRVGEIIKEVDALPLWAFIRAHRKFREARLLFRDWSALLDAEQKALRD